MASRNEARDRKTTEFPNSDPSRRDTDLCHCEERSDAAIFKPKAWHPGTKHGIGKRQNPEFLIRPAGTPHRRFSGSAISRGRKPAFHMLQHISHDQRSYFTAQPRRRIVLHFPVASAPSACYTCRAPRQNFLSSVRYSCVPCVAMIY